MIARSILAAAGILILSPPATGQPASGPASQPKIKLTISRETTYLFGPVNADGTINYVAALDAMAAKGVTPENNAVVLLAKAIGPEFIPAEVRPRVLKALGIASLPEKGDYLVSLDSYARSHPEFLPAGAARQGKTAVDVAFDGLVKLLEAPGRPDDFPIVRSWLKANEIPLGLVVQASRLERYYVPLLSTREPPRTSAIILPRLDRVKEAARGLTARAMLKLGSGDAPSAVPDAMALHRLANLLSQGSTLIERLVGMSIETTAFSVEQALAAPGELSADQTRAHLGELQALPPPPHVVECIDGFERLALLDCVMMLARGGHHPFDLPDIDVDFERRFAWVEAGAKRSALDWDKMLINVNSWYGRLVSAWREPSAAARMAADERLRADQDKLLAGVAREQPGMPASAARAGPEGKTMLTQKASDLLIASLMPSFSRALGLHQASVMRRRLAEVAMALAAYRAEKGEHPTELSALVPGCLKAVPDDLFTDKPLKYRREEKGYLLYSVGLNGADDAAKGPDEHGDDIVVRVK